jgi:hypothetical protein
MRLAWKRSSATAQCETEAQTRRQAQMDNTSGRALAYFEDDPGRPSAACTLTQSRSTAHRRQTKPLYWLRREVRSSAAAGLVDKQIVRFFI